MFYKLLYLFKSYKKSLSTQNVSQVQSIHVND